MSRKTTGFKTFSNVSTFSYLGRNTGLYRRALRKTGPLADGEPRNILIAGPGPFEPFYASSLSPRNKVAAIDVSKAMCDIIREVHKGAEVPLSVLAERCVNINNDGNPRPNRDLKLQERIEQACEEMSMFGFNPSDFIDTKNGIFRVLKSIGEVQAINADIFEFAGRDARQEFDVVAMCTLFVNLRKVMPTEEIVGLFIGLNNLLQSCEGQKSGILAISDTPATVHGKRNIVRLVYDAGFNVLDVVVDNLVNAGGALRGGYDILSVKGGASESTLDKDQLSEKFQKEPFNGCQVTLEVIGSYSLPDFLEETDRVMLAALRNSDNNMDVFTADKPSLISALPGTRTSFFLSLLGK